MQHGFVRGNRPPANGLKLGYQNDGAGELWLAVANTQWGRIPGKAKDDTCWYSYNGQEHVSKNFDWLTYPNTMTLIPNRMTGPPPSARPIGFQNDGRGDIYAAVANTQWGRVAGKAQGNSCWYGYDGREYETTDFLWLASTKMTNPYGAQKMDIDFVRGSSPPANGLNFGRQNDGRGEHWIAVANTPWGKIPGKAQDGKCWYSYNGAEHESQDFHWVIYTSSHKTVRNNNSGPPRNATPVGNQTDGRGAQYAVIALSQWGRIPGKAVGNTCWYPFNGQEHETHDFEWVIFSE